MNRDFILKQPVSKSDLWCLTCNHVYDPNFRICTCMDAECYREFGIEEATQPIRRVVPFKTYLKDKYAGK